MRKPYICICKNKDADQLHREADQRLCFCYIYYGVETGTKNSQASFPFFQVSG